MYLLAPPGFVQHGFPVIDAQPAVTTQAHPLRHINLNTIAAIRSPVSTESYWHTQWKMNLPGFSCFYLSIWVAPVTLQILSTVRHGLQDVFLIFLVFWRVPFPCLFSLHWSKEISSCFMFHHSFVSLAVTQDCYQDEKLCLSLIIWRYLWAPVNLQTTAPPNSHEKN